MKKLPLIASVILLSSSTLHAQSLGDIVNKAKDKVKEKTAEATKDKPQDGAKGKAGDAPPVTTDTKPAASTTESVEMDAYGLPYPPESWTVEKQEAYARTIMADKRPVSVERDREARNYNYRLLTQKLKMPIRFTWDKALVAQFINPYGNGLSLWQQIEGECLYLMIGFSDSRAGYYKTALQKVKEIHFTAAPDSATKSSRSFNASTGVLTEVFKVHMNVRQPEIVERGLASEWVYANMTKAPKRAAPVYVKEHASSWRCARCSQVVASRARPSDANCPGDGTHASGFHQWVINSYEKD